MTKKLDWEKAHKRDIVRTRGSVRATADFPKRPQETKVSRDLLKRLGLLFEPLLKEFSRFAPDVQVASIGRYQEQRKEITKRALAQATAEERREMGSVFTTAGDAAGKKLDSMASKARKALKPKLKLDARPSKAPKIPPPQPKSKSALRELKVSISPSRRGVTITWSHLKTADAWLVVVTQGSATERVKLPGNRRSLTYGKLEPGPAEFVVFAQKGKTLLARGSASRR